MLKQLFLATTMALFSRAAYAQDHSGHTHGQQAQADDHAVGGDFAPITLITYASVTCGHCGNWFTKMWPDVKSSLVETDKIRFVLRELPTAPAALSMTGFAMSECAPAEDYMSVIEYQMENQAEIFEQAKQGKGQEAYAKIGKIAGLDDNEKITACLTDQSNIDHIILSQRRADAAGVSGVPAFFINGEEYKGDQNAKAIIKLVDTMIETGSSSLPKPAENPDKIKIKPAISAIEK